MRKKLALLLGLAAVVALVRLLSRRAVEAGDPSDPRARALRDKLADSRRTAGAEADVAGPAGEPSPADPRRGAPALEPTAPAAAQDVDVEDARQRVYEEGRAALEEMRRSGEI